MPQAFLNCIKRGGKVWTEKTDEQHYQKFCSYDGKVSAGEVHKKKSKGKKK